MCTAKIIGIGWYVNQLSLFHSCINFCSSVVLADWQSRKEKLIIYLQELIHTFRKAFIRGGGGNGFIKFNFDVEYHKQKNKIIFNGIKSTISN